MKPKPNIKSISPKKLIGQKMEMSLIENKTGQLWSGFASRIKEIENRIDNNRISLQVYSANHFKEFNPSKRFVKWALVEVSNIENIPVDMEPFDFQGGLYAVFDYKGSSSDNSIFQYIFSEWIPTSGFQIDNRPHFEVLGDKYKNNDTESEEEIWIPIIQTHST